MTIPLLKNQLPKIPKVSKIAAAYLAGVIDGEGCIQLVPKKRRGCYDLRLQVTNTCVPFLKKLAKHYFANSLFVSTKPVLDSDPKRNTANWKPCAQLIFCNTRAEGILLLVQPFLIAKAEQARLALVYSTLKVRGGTRLSEQLIQRRIALVAALRKLTKKGLS